MAARVRSKIQRLLNDLDSPAADADVPSPAGSTNLVVATTPGLGERALTDEFKHLFMATPTSTTGSDVDFSDTTSDTEPRRGRGGGVATAGVPRRGISPSHDQHMYLERKVLQLMAENKALQLAADQQARLRSLEVAELQSQLTSTVKELGQRQKEVEAATPLLRLKAEDFREKLKDLRISDAQYAELRSMPRGNVHMLDDIKMAVYEATDELRQDNERLRLSIATARETAARADEATARARADASRAAATLAERERDLDLVSESMQARVERLASELEAAMVRSEVLAAKGHMYDELHARADRLAEENLRLQVVEATFKRLEAQTHDLQLRDASREASHEMLVMDKAYLSKQVEFLAEQQRKLELELELRGKKINELQSSRQELFDKLVQTQALKDREGEGRLQRELTQLQASTHADIERIRLDTAEAYEREARLMRELRDQAVDEGARAKAALAELQDMHEKTGLVAAELQRKLEAQVMELQTELRQRSFELAHFKVVLSEKEGLLARSGMQVDMLQDKVQLMMDRYRSLEAEYQAKVVHAEHRQEQERAAATVAAATPAVVAAMQQPQAQPMGPNHEAHLLLLRQERDSLADKVLALEVNLRGAKEALRLAGQPHSFLVQELQTARLRSQEVTARAAALQTALQAREEELAAAEGEREALRRDLDGVLAQRGQLDGMKQAVMRALQGGQPAGQALGGGFALGRRPAAGSPHHGQQATVIVGEGPA